MKFSTRILIVICGALLWMLLYRLVGTPGANLEPAWYHVVFMAMPIYLGLWFGNGGHDINQIAVSVGFVLEYLIAGFAFLLCVQFFTKKWGDAKGSGR